MPKNIPSRRPIADNLAAAVRAAGLGEGRVVEEQWPNGGKYYVIPFDGGTEAMNAMLQQIAASGQASFLAVLKTFGDVPSPGLLSFPRPGITLALDFANHGPSTLELFARLDEIVRSVHGAWYPAKDARMSPGDFRASYPALDRFIPQIDPAFTSDFWKRMTAS
jgi:hypothetical protein